MECSLLAVVIGPPYILVKKMKSENLEKERKGTEFRSKEKLIFT